MCIDQLGLIRITYKQDSRPFHHAKLAKVLAKCNYLKENKETKTEVSSRQRRQRNIDSNILIMLNIPLTDISPTSASSPGKTSYE